MANRRSALIAVALLGLAVSGCGGGSPSASKSKTAGTIGAGSSLPPSTAPASSVPSTAAPTMLPAATQGSAGEVPWSIVGSGWLLAQWSASNPDASASGTATSTSTLFLIDPEGGRYDLGLAPSATQLSDWSGDGHRALLVSSDSSSATVLDLQTDSTNSISIGAQQPFADLDFTRPTGQAFIVPGMSQESGTTPIQRFSLAGSLQQSYPTTFPEAGSSDGSYVESPDGADLALDTRNGLELVSNGGQPVAFLPFPPGQSTCSVVRWWNADEMLDSCPSQLWLVPASGSSPTPLTSAASPGAYLDAWSLPEGTYVEEGACGTTWLDNLNADGSTNRLAVPNTPTGGSVAGLGAFGNQLAITLTPGCDTGSAAPTSNSLSWYDPATDVVTPLLGSRVNGGWVDQAVLFGS